MKALAQHIVEYAPVYVPLAFFSMVLLAQQIEQYDKYEKRNKKPAPSLVWMRRIFKRVRNDFKRMITRAI